MTPSDFFYIVWPACSAVMTVVEIVRRARAHEKPDIEDGLVSMFLVVLGPIAVAAWLVTLLSQLLFVTIPNYLRRL